MSIIYPGLGLGGSYRPRLAFTLGYAPVGSVLPPVGEIISAEPIGDIISVVPADVTSDEVDDVISSFEELLVVSAETQGVVSSEIFGAIAERLQLSIITFTQLAFHWGSILGVQGIAQTITATSPFYLLTAVEIAMRYDTGTPTDDVTLDVHQWDPFFVGPPPVVTDGIIVASVTIPASDIPSDWGIVRFEFAKPLLFTDYTSFALVFSRTELSETDFYGIYINQSANYPSGEAWAEVSGSWSGAGSSDLPLKIYGLDIRSSVESEEPDDVASELPSDIISDEPIDDIESEEPT